MRRRPLLAALLTMLVPVSVLPPALVAAQGDAALDAVTLTLEPVGGGTVTGLAVLSPRDGDTGANVLAVGAPAGAIAVIHAGTCAAIDAAPVGLLGDVGTTGQLSTTIPVSLAAIADGTHVVAVHPGLDLETTIACGAIPKAAASAFTPAPGASLDPASERFQSPTYGFSIDWDAPWQRLDWDPGEDYEGVSLGDGTATVSVVGFPLEGADATACLDAWEGRLLGLLRIGTIADLLPATDEQGNPVRSGDSERAQGAYQYLYKTEADPQGTVIVEQVDCWRLSGATMLEITADVPVAARETEGPLVEALMSRLKIDEPTVDRTQPPATAVPTAQPTAEPTADAACEGVDAWVSGTLARSASVKAVADDLNAAMSAGMGAYAKALADSSLAIQRLQIDQQQAAVPGSATDAQTDVITMFQKLVEAYDLMAQAYTSGNSAVLQQGLSAAGEAQSLATAARSAIRAVATPCGITVPAA